MTDPNSKVDQPANEGVTFQPVNGDGARTHTNPRVAVGPQDINSHGVPVYAALLRYVFYSFLPHVFEAGN